MQITDVKIFLVDEEKLKAFVSIVLDRCFMINDIKVIQGREGLFISMPSRRKRNGQFKDVAHPLNHETRAWLEECVLTEYGRAVADGDAASQTATPEPSEPSPVPPDQRLPSSGVSQERQSPTTMAASATDSSGSERGDRSLDEVQRRHLSDTFWSVG